MKIIFIKDHLENKEGDEIEATDERGYYLIAVGAAEPAKEKRSPAPAREKAETKHTPKKKK